jgi:hypothetical protein
VLIFSLQLHQVSQMGPQPSGPPHRTSCAFLNCPMRATFPASVTLPNFCILLIFSEECKSFPASCYNLSWVCVDFSARSIFQESVSYLGLYGWGVRVRVHVGVRFLSSPRRPDRFCGPPSDLSNGYGCSFLWDKAAGAWRCPLTSN